MSQGAAQDSMYDAGAIPVIVLDHADAADDARVIHLMGEPSETRHLVVSNEQGVISPSWSIHSGVSTKVYAFIWAMAGENQAFDDMDPAPVTDLH